jgi:DNA-binding GntR family transcriptional regulator
MWLFYTGEITMENMFTTKSDYVFRYLKEQILSNELEPGENLVISKISKELNISAIPVREALKALENEGLVEIEAHKTAKVVTFSLEKLKQIGTVRAGLEGYAARLAVEYINQEQLDRLDNILEETKEAMQKHDSEVFNAKNMEFHRYLYQIPPFPMLYDMIISVWDGGKWTRAIFAISPDRMDTSFKEHLEIVEALKSKDQDKVEKLVRQHRMNASQQLEDVILKQKK